MIPFTPDERRAQFAPSQNVGGPVDPDILDIIGERPQPTMAQQVQYEVPEPRPIDPDVIDIVNQTQMPMMASLMGASQVNPDQAAEAKRLGSQIGIGQDIALRNLEDVRKRAFMADVQRRDIARANPVLAGFLSDPTFANEASDDIEPLSRFERTMDYIADIGQYALDLPSEFGAGFRTGQVLVEAGMLGSTAQLRGRATEDEVQKWNQYQEELRTLSGDAGFWRQAGEYVGQLTRSGEEAVKGGVAGGVAGAGAALLAGQLGPQMFLPEEVVTVPAATLFGVGAGIASSFATTSARTMAGNNYMKNIESGMDPDVARVTALGVGVIGGALELFGAKLVAAPFKGLWNKVVSDAANEALVQPTVAKAVANAGLQYSKAVGGEIGTEVSQQITEIAFDEIAGYASDPNFESRFATPEGRMSIRDELKDVIVRTALGISVLGGIGPGSNLYVDLRRASKAVRSQQAIQSVVEATNAANLKRRDPDALEAFGNAALRETPAFIRGDTLRGILDANEVSNAEIDAIVPGLSTKIQEAVDADNFVSLPLAQFGVRLAGTKVGDAMVPHLTVDPTAMTPAELEAFNTNVQEFTALAAAEYEAKTEAESAFVQEADQVATTMRERLIAAGRDPALAEVESLVHQAFVVTQAARQGKTPAQFEAESGLREIVGAEMPAAPLEQATRMTLADVEQAFTDLGVEQRLIETDAAIRPGIIRVPENLRAEGRATNAMQRLIEYADQVGKRIDVSPTSEFGANKRRLVEWYKRLGFVENKGRNKDFAISATMYRVPKPAAPGVMEQASRIDADYMAAVERGDMETAQRMVDEAAKATGYTQRAYHGSPETDITEFSQQRTSYGFFFSPDKDTADFYSGDDGRLYAVYLNMGKTADLDDEMTFDEIAREAVDYNEERDRDAVQSFAARLYKEGMGKNAAVTAFFNEQDGIEEVGNDYTIEQLLSDNYVGQEEIDALVKEIDRVQVTNEYNNTAPVVSKELQAAIDAYGSQTFYMEYQDDFMRAAENMGYNSVALADPSSTGEAVSFVVFDPTRIKSADAITYDEAGNIIPLSRRFDITSPRIFEQAAMATRVPTAVKPLEDALNDVLLADFPTFLRDEKFVAKNLAKFKELNAPIRIDPNATDQQQLEQIIEHMTSNLLWLHDAMDPAIRERARMWYVGGRRLVDWLAERHGMSPMGAATVFAVLSPQKNWYENVGLGIRITDIVATQGAATMDAEMQDAYLNSLRKAKTKLDGQLAKHDEAKPKRGKKAITDWEAKRADLVKEAKAAGDKVAEAQGNIDSIGNRTLAELLRDRDFFLAAIMVRWFDQTKNDRTYPVISPEGGVGSPMLTDAGTPASIRYGSYNEVAKAIAAYVDGRAENVHYLIGGEHKVRNFYNNLFNPEDPRFATIDTHAIAAAYLMPLAGTDKLVQHGLGGGVGNAMFGMGGGYAVFYEAYRRAAEARGIQPREMQSITWEAIRGMFEAAMKGGLKAPVAATWKRYVDGEIDMDSARADVMQRAGGITTPSWVALPTDMQPAAGYEGVSRTAADEQAKRIAAQPTAASVMFEVAPDPADAALVQRWEALSPQQRQAISVRVAEDMIPRILREYGVAADMVMQIGGWEGATNVGFALRMPSGPLVRQIAQSVGYALSQQAVFTLSATEFQGSDRADIVVVKLQPGTTVEQIGDLYERKLYPLGIQGHATVQDSMIISLDPGVDGAILADTIAAAVAGDGRIVEITHATGWRSLDETRITDEAARAADEGRRAEGAAGRRRVDAYRREATRLVAEYIGTGILEQAARGPARGGYDPSRLKILFGKGADFTTGAHELTHYYVDYYTKQALAGTAAPQMLADLDIMFKFMGVAGATPEERLAAFNAMPFETARPLIETITYNAEIYLFEGKAPSLELAGVFDRMLAFFRRAYKSIADFVTQQREIYRREFGRELPELSDELRQVFDRMLADERQIKQAQAVSQMRGQFTVKPEGMDDADWAAYQEMAGEATNAAIADMTKASLRQMEWLSRARSRIIKDMQARHTAQRKEVRERVQREVQQDPLYRAMAFLRRGQVVAPDGTVTEAEGVHRIDRVLAAEFAPTVDLARLGGRFGVLQDDGLHPDIVAEMFGFPAGASLLQALADARPMREVVEDRTDAEMLRLYGEMNTPEAREQEIQKALHNEARARLVGVELRFMGKIQQPVRVLLEAARQAAKQVIDRKIVRDIRPSEFVAAEAKASREATAAMQENKPDVAVRAKRAQLLNNQLAKAALESKDEIDAALKDFRKFFRADSKIADSRDLAMVMAARSILASRGIGQSDKAPSAYIEQLKANNPGVYAELEPIITQGGVGDYRQMTVAEFRVLAESVNALWTRARRDRQIQVEDRKVALDTVITELKEALSKITRPEVQPGVSKAVGPADVAKRRLMEIRAAARRIEPWSDAIDGSDPNRPFTTYVWQPVKDATTRFRQIRNDKIKILDGLVRGLTMPTKSIAAPELGYTFGAGNSGVGKAELLGAMLHTGNISNYRKLLLGRGWASMDDAGNMNDANWRQFVARMISEGILTKEDFDFLQAVWDLNEDIKPLLQKTYYDLEGYYFKEVPASPVVTPFGTYRGGYVPAATDKFMVADAAQKAGMEELEQDWRFSLPSTGMGMTKSRVESYLRPLALDVRQTVTHVDAALRFAIIQPAISDVLKILKNRSFAAELNAIDPTAISDMLLPWLNRAARQTVSQPGRSRLMDAVWTGVRTRTGMAIMFGNIRNALQNITGYFPAALKVKPTYLKNAMATYLGSPRETASMIAATDPFMDQRMRDQVYEMQERMNDLLINPSKFAKIKAWNRQHAYFLQTAFQNQVDIVVWLGAYNQSLAESGIGVAEDKARKQAIRDAGAAVRLTQGSMLPEDIAAFEAGTPFYRTFTQFASYFNGIANLNATEFIKTVRAMGFRGGKGKLLYIYMLGVMMPAIVSDAIVRSLGGGWEDDDEDGYLDVYMDWFFGSQLRMGAAFVPFGASAYRLVAAPFTTETYDDRMTSSPSVSAIEAATVGTGKAIINVFDEEKEVTGKNVRDVLTAISLATGVPVSAAGKPIGYLVDVARGKIEPEGPIDFVRGLVTGTATPSSRRR